MTAVGRILYIAGYTFDFENNVYVPPLDIEVGRQNTYIARSRAQKKEPLRRLILTTTYKIIIYMFILWLVPYSLYMAIRDKNAYTFGRSWFQVLIALQHYYATAYFSGNHFYENIMCNEKLKKYMTISVPCLLIFSVMLGVLNICLLNAGYRYNGYDELFNASAVTGKVLLSILIFFDSFYSYMTFTINSSVFVINMMYHKNTVSNYSDSLGNYIKNSMNVVRKINIVATEFSQMKYMFDKTVELLTPFFSVLNFVGFITIYFYLNAVQNQDLGVSEFINVLLFIIVEYVYIQAIQAVNVNISNIGAAITSNSMITTFFGNKQFNRTMPVIEHNAESHANREDGRGVDRGNENNHHKIQVQTDLNIKRHDDIVVTQSNHGLRDSTSTLDHSDIRLEIDRMDVSLMASKLPRSLAEAVNGTSDEHRESLHSPGGTVGIEMSALNLPERQGIDPQADLAEYYKHADTVDNPVDNPMTHPINHNISEAYLNANSTMMKQVMIATISTEQMLDWLVLRDIVSGRWTTFTVFGVEFTDTTLISKLFGAGVGVLVTAQLGSLLKWW